MARGMRRNAKCLHLLRFGLARASGYVVNLTVFAAAVQAGGLRPLVNVALLELLVTIARTAEVPARACAVAVGMPGNFPGNRLWTFREPQIPAGRAARAPVVTIALPRRTRG